MSKKEAIIGLCALLCMLSVGSVYAYEQNFTYEYSGNTAGASINVVSLRYEPYPVEPGELFKIHTILKNTGSDYADDATCMIANKQPFTAYKEKKKSIGKLAPGREFALDFEVYVDSNAFERTEYLEIQCTDNPANDFWNIEKVPIEIRLRYAVFDIVSVKTEPEMLRMGKPANLTITILNNAESPIRDVSAELFTTDTPVFHVDGITFKKVKNINKNDRADIVFSVLVEPGAKSGFYKIPLAISYIDGSGYQKNFSTFITVQISENPSYYIIAESYKNVAGGKEITLKFVNNGLEDLKFFNVKILDSKNVKIKSPNQIYIGDLDSDDYLTEKFTAGIPSKTTIQLEVTYKDSLNNDYVDYVNVVWDESKVKNETEGSRWTLVIILIAAAGIIYYFYRRRKAKKATEI